MNEYLQSIFEMQRASSGITAADYIAEDGLLHCGKCHTPKQSKLPPDVLARCRKITPDFPEITYCTCNCIEKENERLKRAKELKEIEIARESCFPDEAFRSWRFETDRGISDREAMQKALTYAEHLDEMYKLNVGLLIYGDVGRGKSFIAACIANRAVEQGFQCLMTNFSRIIDGAWKPKDEDKERYFNSFAKYDFLVIDDFERERSTGYTDEIVINVIERRCNSGKPIILTTNISPSDLVGAETIGRKRIYSRLFDMTKPLEVAGYDLRRMISVEKNARVAEILGF